MDHTPQSQLKLLLAKGKEQGYLTYAEVNDHLPADMVDSDQIEDIIQMINDMGIRVFEEAPDADDMMMSEDNTDEDAAEEAAAALATVESELGRTTDPVRMYMREMGTVELLTREGEIVIAKRIEEGINTVQCSVSEYPQAIAMILEQFDQYEADEIRLSDIISGFVNPDDDDVAPTATNIGSEVPDSDDDDDDDDDDSDDDEDEEEGPKGPDPEEAKEKFTQLREAYEKSLAIIAEKGRDHPEAIGSLFVIGELFKEFRLVPKQFDRLVKSMRTMMDRVRIQERLILKLVVEQAKMPKKNFVKAFTGKETNLDWFIKRSRQQQAIRRRFTYGRR
ncbi:RNA polymerase sigma factor region1.1 domain-containing protein [Shewanella sp. HL-SH4]|uniref:RNA polymerase sigma factor region1.1 domain-containing protein n=1 Tax=Shewanella sp. HL-SH4 TaxID=3436240 RepID=UPI003EB7C6D6